MAQRKDGLPNAASTEAVYLEAVLDELRAIRKLLARPSPAKPKPEPVKPKAAMKGSKAPAPLAANKKPTKRKGK